MGARVEPQQEMTRRLEHRLSFGCCWSIMIPRSGAPSPGVQRKQGNREFRRRNSVYAHSLDSPKGGIRTGASWSWEFGSRFFPWCKDLDFVHAPSTKLPALLWVRTDKTYAASPVSPRHTPGT